MDYFDGNLFRPLIRGIKKFETKWLKEETVSEIVKTSWEKAKLAGIGPTLADRTRAVHADLHSWDREILKGPKQSINKLKKS